MEQETKKCSKCGEDKELKYFSNDKSKSDGKYPRCKICKYSNDKQYREKNPEKKKEMDKKYYEKNKEKIKLNSITWYENNKDYGQQVRKKWYNNNKEKVDISRKKHYQENIQFYKEYHRIYNRDRYRTNLNYRIKTITNKRIRDYIKNKNKPTLEFLGCSIDDFKKWIQYQFDDNMNWDNMGKYWSFDHVIPCNNFDLSKQEEIDKCYNWTNLRPLEKPENSSKGSKIIPEVIEKHKEILNNYLANKNI